MSRWPVANLAFGIMVVLARASTAEERHIQIVSDGASIYSATDQRTLIGRVRQGIVLELNEEAGTWYEVYLFTGEPRYVRRSDAKVVNYKPIPPADVATRRRVFAALVAAEDRAQAEADAEIPPDDVLRNIALDRVLDDKYKLQAMQRFGLDPPVHGPIVVEGAKANWLRK